MFSSEKPHDRQLTEEQRLYWRHKIVLSPRTFSASARADSASAAALCAEASSRRISASSDAAASLAAAASRRAAAASSRAAAASPPPPPGFDAFDVRCPESDLFAGPAAIMFECDKRVSLVNLEVPNRKEEMP